MKKLNLSTAAGLILGCLAILLPSQAYPAAPLHPPGQLAAIQSPLALPAGTRPGYLIIAPQALINDDTFDRFMNFKAGLGFNIFKTSIGTIEDGFEGVDKAEKIRNYLIYVYQPRTVGPTSIRYLLLVGDHALIPHRKIYPFWKPTDTVETASVTHTDWYYADLTGDWDSNGDGNFGQAMLLDQPIDQADLHYEIAVGRLPFTDTTNVQSSLGIIMRAEMNGGDWKQSVLQGAAFMQFTGLSWDPLDDEDGAYEDEGTRIGTETDNAVLMEYIWEHVLLPLGFNRTRMYETSLNAITQPQSAYTDDLSLSWENLRDAWHAQAYGLVNFASHGETDHASRLIWSTEWVEGGIIENPTEPIEIDGVTSSRYEVSSDSYLTSNHVNELFMPDGGSPVVAISACYTGGFVGPQSLGSSLLAHSKASAFFGSLGSSGFKTGWSAPTVHGYMQDLMLRFDQLLLGSTPRVGDAVYQTLSQLFDEASHPRSDSLVKYVLYGDPSMSYWGEAAAFDGPWPMFRHDIRNSGLTTNPGPSIPQVRWTFPLVSGGFTNGVTSPIVDRLGRIYAGTPSGRLYAIRANGAEAWHYDAGGAINAAPILTVAGNLYFRAEDGYLYAVTNAGQLRWQQRMGIDPLWAGATPSIPPISNSPRVGSDGTVVALATIQDNPLAVLTCARPTGMIYRTSLFATSGASGTPAIARDGTLYISFWNGLLVPLSPDCQDGNGFNLGIAATGSPAIGPDGTIYIGNNAGRLYAIHPDMSERWHFDTLHGAPANINSSPAVGSDGSIYFGSWDHRVYALNSNGSLRWQYDTGGLVDSSPALDATTVYIVGGTSPNAALLAINRTTGALTWSVNIGGSALWGSSPAIGLDNVIYVISSTGLLYAIGPYERIPAPAEVESDPDSLDKITITWLDNSTNESGFSLERRIGWSGAYLAIATLPANQTAYGDTGLLPDTTYFYRVRALGSNPSGYSNETFARTLRPLPAAPYGLALTPASFYAIRLDWSPLDPYATGAAIYRSDTAAGPFVQVGLTHGGATSFLDINPIIRASRTVDQGDPRPGKIYYYYIKAFNDQGYSTASAPLSGSTRSLTLTAPTDLQVEMHDFSYASLTWEYPSVSIKGFIIERTSSFLPGYEVLAQVSATVRTYRDYDLRGGYYEYRLRAYTTASESPFAYSPTVFHPEALYWFFIPLLER